MLFQLSPISTIALATTLITLTACGDQQQGQQPALAQSTTSIDRQDTSFAVPATANAMDFIEIFEQLSGSHPGMRKGHARGVCAAGTFFPDEGAAAHFASRLFNQNATVIMRFSMAGGNPEADERARSPRGIGVKFQLNDTDTHHLAGLSTPLFAGKNPQQFLGLLRINRKIQAGEATLEDRENYLAAEPEAAHQGVWVSARAPAAEYTSDTYYGVHTFIAQLVEGDAVPFRWRLVPESGERRLTEDEIADLPSAFLEDRLSQRLAHDGEVWFRWQWVMGLPSDTTSDPSQLWPQDRRTVTVGRLRVNAVGGEACTPVNFDPNLLAAGVTPSDDPVLALRSAAYAISQGRRLANQ